MKKMLTLAVFLCLACSCSYAKIWRVNNAANIIADFSNPNTAANSASVMPGDTLHIEPTGINYSSIDLHKPLVIIGGGYLLDTANSGNGGLQATANQSMVGGFFLYSTAGGTKIMGMVSNSYVYYQEDSVNNISFEKCYLNGFVMNNKNCRNLTVRKSVIAGGPAYFNSGTLSNATIENCIIATYFDCSAFVSGCVVRNCVFDQNSVNINNCYFTNNIVSSNIAMANSIVKNNLFSTSPTFPAGAVNNQINIPLSAICVLTGSFDSRYRLKPGSPAIGAGVTIAAYTPDCGAYGGPDPYHLSGIPSIPTIYQLSVPSSIQLNTPSMNVTLSTRNNN